MVLFSSELTVIQDSIIKVTDKIIRDYVELESLRSSHSNFVKFVSMTVEYVKRQLFYYFDNRKPDYDIVFYGEDENDFKTDYRYLIIPLDGIINMIHAIPYFCVSIALQKRDKNGDFKTICGIIDNPIAQETFITEENKGAYINSRRIRVSATQNLKDSVFAIKNGNDKDFICKYVKKCPNLLLTNSEFLNICNVASGKYDGTIIPKNDSQFYDLFLLLIRESGGLFKELSDGTILISNDFLQSSFNHE